MAASRAAADEEATALASSATLSRGERLRSGVRAWGVCEGEWFGRSHDWKDEAIEVGMAGGDQVEAEASAEPIVAADAAEAASRRRLRRRGAARVANLEKSAMKSCDEGRGVSRGGGRYMLVVVGYELSSIRSVVHFQSLLASLLHRLSPPSRSKPRVHQAQVSQRRPASRSRLAELALHPRNLTSHQ